MKRLIEDLNENKEWRVRELDQLKRILSYENAHDQQKYELLSKYAVPTACAIWEGFFKEAIGYYFTFFNRNNMIEKDLLMITNIIEHNNIVKKTYQDFETKKKLVEDIHEVFNNPQFNEYKPEIGLKKLNDTNKFLMRVKLNPLGDEYRVGLNTMIDLRHTIFHGEKSDRVLSVDDVSKYLNLVINLMNELEDNIINKSMEFISTN